MLNTLEQAGFAAEPFPEAGECLLAGDESDRFHFRQTLDLPHPLFEPALVGHPLEVGRDLHFLAPAGGQMLDVDHHNGKEGHDGQGDGHRPDRDAA